MADVRELLDRTHADPASDDATTLGTTALRWSQVNASSEINGPVFDRSGATVNVDHPDFGGDVGSAITWALANGYRSVTVPAGTHTITSPVSETLANNHGFVLRGEGYESVIRPSSAMTMFTVNMGGSNLQGFSVCDLHLDLDGTDSVAFDLENAGQRGQMQRVFIHNPATSATNTLVKISTDTHSFAMRDCRIRGGSSTSGDAIHVNANIVLIDGVDVTHCGTAIKLSSGTNVTSLTVRDCRFEDNSLALHVNEAAARRLTFADNRCESMTDQHVFIKGFDAINNKAMNIKLDGNYFTGLDSTGAIAIELWRVVGTRIFSNHFKGTSTDAQTVFYNAAVTDVSLDVNTVDGVAEIMQNATSVPALPYADVRITQSSRTS